MSDKADASGNGNGRKVQQYKLDAVAAVKEAVEATPNLYFADYRGLSVAQITELRGQLREHQTVLKVIKNRYTKIALADLGLAGVDSFLDGPTAMAFVGGDVSSASKALVDFGRNASLELKGGYVDGKALSSEQVVELSRLPSREQLYSMLMGAMQSPVRNLAYVLGAVVQDLARVLQAVAEQKSKNGD